MVKEVRKVVMKRLEDEIPAGRIRPKALPKSGKSSAYVGSWNNKEKYGTSGYLDCTTHAPHDLPDHVTVVQTGALGNFAATGVEIPHTVQVKDVNGRLLSSGGSADGKNYTFTVAADALPAMTGR